MQTKHDLRAAIASKNRGISATPSDKQMIASIIAQVEDRNPTPDPLTRADLLAGDWRLLYTTSTELLGIDKVPLAQLGEIYQCIRPERSRIYNIAEVASLPYCEALVSVVAGFEAATTDSMQAPRETDDDVEASRMATKTSTRRVNVRFNRAVLGLQRLLGYQSPAQYIEAIEATERFNLLQGIDFPIEAGRQQGWLEITYLDENMRIGRGNQGSVFVLTK